MIEIPRSNLQRFLVRIRDKPRIRRILLEGDSWFSFPGLAGGNLATLVKSRYRHHAATLSLAAPGDIVGRMLNQLSLDTLESLLGQYRFEALLFSGGGNDLIGDHFDDFLKRSDEAQAGPLPPNAPQVVVDHLRAGAFADALAGFNDRLRALCRRRDRARADCAIFTHTYDYAFPDGRPAIIGPFRFGPWMKPSLDRVEVPMSARQELIRWMVDAFAAMLLRIETEVAGFHVVDCRGVLTSPADWNDELHPTGRGFKRLLKERWAPLLDPVIR